MSLTARTLSEGESFELDVESRPGAAANAINSAGLRVAYLVNQYPKLSHSFIRREICAIERQGIEVLRLSLRGWDAEQCEAADRMEQAHTRYVLQGGLAGLIPAVFMALLRAPRRLLAALGLALRLGRKGQRGLAYHLIYLAEACKIAVWLKEESVQHLHAHFGTNATEVALLAHTLSGVPFSFTMHGSEEFDRPEQMGLAEKIHGAAFVAAVTSYTRGQLMRWSDPADWPKLRQIRCGVDRSYIDLPATPPVVTPRLVCVGRFCEQKAHLLLLEAAHRLAEAGVEFELVLAGDGELRPLIEAAITRWNLVRQVRITGWIDGAQVREEILAARAVVLPSVAEGLPVVLMEAMALRRPVLTTWITGIPELVVAGEHGWLVPSGSVGALAEAMAACLNATPETLAAMGERARERVLLRHDIDHEAGRLAILFRAVISRSHSERNGKQRHRSRT